MRYLICALAAVLPYCVQSTAIVDPVTNKAYTASTAPTQGTVTLSVNLTAQGANHQSQAFSALLFQNGQHVGYITLGTGNTDSTGKASIAIRSVDGNSCMTSNTATLSNGTYELWFAIIYANQPAFSIAPAACGANGHLVSMTGGNLYSMRSQVTINGNSVINVSDATTPRAGGHTFQLSGTTPTPRNVRCFLTHPSATNENSTHPFANFYGTTAAGNLTTSTDSGGNTLYVPDGMYKYFCYIDVDANVTFGNSGDKVASGTTNVTGGATTYLTNASFSTIP